MRLAAAALFSLLVTTAAMGSTASMRHGRTRVSATVNGRVAKVTVKDGRKTSAIELTTPTRCNNKRLAELFSKYTLRYRSGFVGLPERGKLTMSRTASSAIAFELALATLLEAGKATPTDTEFPSFSVKVDDPPPAGETKQLWKMAISTVAIKGLPKGAFELTRTADPRPGVHDEGKAIIHADGSAAIERTVTYGESEPVITLTRTESFDTTGRRVSLSSRIEAVDGFSFDVPAAKPGKSKGKSKGKGKSNTGDEIPEGPGIAEDGTFSVPGIAIPHREVAQIINWHRLASALITPNHKLRGESEPSYTPEGAQTCSHLSEDDFYPWPRPKFLPAAPTDIVEAIRSTQPKGEALPPDEGDEDDDDDDGEEDDGFDEDGE